MAEEAFLELVERAGGIAPRQAREAVRATLCTLAERISRGEAEDLAVFVPPEYRALLTSAGEPPERFGVDEFVRRVARREGLDSRTATRHVRAVFTALGQAASRDALSNLAAQLSTDFDPLLEAARRAGAVAPEQARAGAAQEDEPQPASPRTRATTAPHHWVFGAYQAVDRTLQRLFEVDARLLYGFVVPVLAISGLVVLLAADPTNWLLGLAVVLLLVASLIVVLGVVRMLGEDDATADRGSSPSG